MGLIGKLFDTMVTRPQYKSGWQRPWDRKFVAQITGIEDKGDRKAILVVNIHTGEETPWQGPRQDRIKTILPKDVTPQVGQRVMVGSAGGGSSDSAAPRPVLWDEPAPELPPMRFPQVAGGDDPQVMIEELKAMTTDGRLDQEGFERGRAYLENGGWPKPD